MPSGHGDVDHLKALSRSPWPVAIIVVATTFAAAHACAQSQAEEARAAQTRLRRDVVSLAVFRYLGKTHCMDTMTFQQPANFATEYGILYNQLYPLPRLISQASLRATFSTLEKSLVSVTGYRTKSRSKFVDPISTCHRLYEAGLGPKKAYKALVSDPKSLHSSEDVDLHQHIRDYLDGYFIKAPG
jgi:hypothetical protein